MKIYSEAESDALEDPGTPVRARPTPEVLCRLYAERVYQFATMIARDDLEAEDLAQSALERALRALPQYQPERGTLEGWLWRIAVNVARDSGRGAKRRHLLMQRLAEQAGGQPPADDIPGNISDGVLVAAIRRLTPLQRSVVALRFGGDLEYASVGAALGISPLAARAATHRALTTLRAVLRKTEDN